MKTLAALVVLGVASAGTATVQTRAVQIRTVRVEVEAKLNLTFSRDAPSELTLTTPWGVQKASLTGGTAYAADPENYFSRLDPVTLNVQVPTGTKPGAYPVSLKTALYVCDQSIHLCSVRPAQARGELTVGQNARPLTLTLNVPKLRSF